MEQMDKNAFHNAALFLETTLASTGKMKSAQINSEAFTNELV